ncbi:MAG: leucine-rich repeat domain-containing protein [Ruminococcus sp.]|nr:leucine-rich repeat domain-containing protein [Ruminococcus sp.]
MYKRFISCTAALMLAAGGLGALPASDISASAVEIDASKVKTWGNFKYIVWDDEYEGDTSLYEEMDVNPYNAVEIVDYKITGDTIEFPDKIDGHYVKFIDSEKLKASNIKRIKLPSNFYCFYDHSGWASNSYADNRETIAEALGFCEKLEYIDIDTYDYKSRDGIVYSSDYWDEYGDYDEYDMHRLVFVPPMVSSYTFPKDTKRIDSKAFYRNRRITSVTVPSTIETIGEEAFMCCYALSKVVMNCKLNTSEIGKGMFNTCSELKSVTLPDGIQRIGECCFYDCSKLESIKLPDSVTQIHGFAFSGCSSLKSVDLGKSLYSIGDGAFSDLFNLKSLRLPETIKDIYEGSVGMTYSAEEHIYVPIPGFKLYCYPGAGEKYAKASGLDYELVATPMKEAKITLVDGEKYAYTGKVIKPKVKVTYKGKTLEKGTDYRIAYQGLKDPGKRVLTVIGLNDFSGKVKVNFIIVPKASTLTKLTSPKKKAVKLTWKRDKTCDGYQLITSYRKDFKKKAKVVVIKNNKTVAKTITGLKSGKRVYAKVRAYTTVDGKRVYGKCSKVKNIICK